MRKIVGVALQEAGLDPLMNANDHFDIQGSVYGVTRRDIAMRRKRYSISLNCPASHVGQSDFIQAACNGD